MLNLEKTHEFLCSTRKIEKRSGRKEVYMKIVEKIALVFTIIGAVNWGLIGLLNFNLVETLFNNDFLENMIYIIVGICGLINIGILFMDLKIEND